MTAQSNNSFAVARLNPERWGRIAESAVGAHLANAAAAEGMELFYWRDAPREIDFALSKKTSW